MNSDRRRFLLSLLAVPALAPLWAEESSQPSDAAKDKLPGALAELERGHGGRLGVCILDTGTGRSTGHRTDERFAMCSTFKVLLAALILRDVAEGKLSGEKLLTFTANELVPYSPVTSKHTGTGMTVLELARTAQQTSDNTAANLLLGLLGGPAGFTKRLRDSGDAHTRLDRMEPDMNLVPAGEERDTTTPSAMAASLAHYLVGDGLGTKEKTLLFSWMQETKTGRRRLRAGLPEEWRSGDKTGTGIAAGMPNKYNDVALTFPPGRDPLIVTAYYEASDYFETMRREDEAVLAAVGSLLD